MQLTQKNPRIISLKLPSKKKKTAEIFHVKDHSFVSKSVGHILCHLLTEMLY
jgi:hypothetical protein